jgi:hypothetical protein
MDGTTEALGCAADGTGDSCNVAAATSWEGIGTVMLLLFPALILTIARGVGKSVRATIFIHAIYNLTGSYPQVVVFLKLFEN